MLPDILQADLDVVFCGTAAGRRSAELQQYYAHPGNAFWQILYETGFTDEILKSNEFVKLPEFGIGLTDLNKLESGSDTKLSEKAFDIGGLTRKIKDHNPRVLAFTSKNAAKVFFGRKKIEWGRQKEKINNTQIWVLPSTSGQAKRHWSRLKHHWFDLAKFLGRVS